MFVSALKKAHHAVEGVAYEAALGLAAVLLACGAILLAAGGLAFWLTTIMPVYSAFFIAALIVAIAAAFVFYLSRRDPSKSKEEEEEEEKPEKSFSSVAGSLKSIAQPMDVVASGLFARQFKKAPVATMVATVAVGAVLGMIANSDDD
ncbi:hypothetical protein [Hyphococcus sp.]|uniref:hypothetical protein n=1 Tax=Hyphococcus sp. TaxID=2038636 RepID=UPI003CCC007B